MSEINGDAHRARRRASRSAGPPVEDASSVTGKVTERISSGTAKDAVGTGSAKGGAESAAPVRTAESVGPPEGAVRAAATVELAKGAESMDSAKSGELSEAGSAASGSSGSPSVDLGKPEADEPTPADETAADSDDIAKSTGRDQLGLKRILAMAASAVLVLALVVGAVVTTFLANAADRRDARRTEYVQTARQAILNLTTIRADSAKEDIDRILSMASGQFKSEFDGRVDPFLSVVQQAKVVSNGEIVEAALESDADDSAKVLVAAKQTLTNAGQAEPQTRYYRFRVTVSRTDSGLSASNVEFVP
ncbi:Mce-associated membrane protein [Nocardia amikacinitolerans]|uniref:hypothetical protein n=1 Tax=Nocardia amikacinitolerans TaxID=756689 RepID=UPI000A47A2F0|nr:hypothetical protein [Nocardia amikacinitolerans]MCP2317272.1 Mce-associated membrane protein [Nocardia amikacinitolerans]